VKFAVSDIGAWREACYAWQWICTILDCRDPTMGRL